MVNMVGSVHCAAREPRVDLSGRSQLQRYLYPYDLLSSDAFEESDERSWWLVYTLSRQEKAIAESLLAQGLPHYLPIIGKTRVVRRRARTSSVPLFPGYLFLHGSDEERVAALKTNRVSRIHRVVDASRLRQDLLQVSSLIEVGAPLTPEARLEPGNPVRVCAGPFKGFEGVVIRRNRRTRLLVAVDYLKQGASVEIDDFMLEPL